MNIITELAEGTMTLQPATEADRLRALAVFPIWEDEDDGRFVITIDVELDRAWQDVTTEEGVSLRVRRADCGAGCFCAGEFKFA